jgi:hypothetical protein
VCREDKFGKKKNVMKVVSKTPPNKPTSRGIVFLLAHSLESASKPRIIPPMTVLITPLKTFSEKELSSISYTCPSPANRVIILWVFVEWHEV